MDNNSTIKTRIKCQNIAPIENLDKEILSNSLKMAVFANNGSGKTFISRLFRLFEKNDSLELLEDGSSPTDKLLSFDKTTGSFSFEIRDKDDSIKEDVSISFSERTIPTIPDTFYLYHTFNQDYVDHHIRALNYEKDSEIEGFILGKANIDLRDDEDKLEKIKNESADLLTIIERDINTYLDKNIRTIQNVVRLDEYRTLLNTQSVFRGVYENQLKVEKNFEELLADYNKIKSVPEQLEDIQTIDEVIIDFNIFCEIKDNLQKEYSLSMLAEEFKRKIKDRQVFIEQGLELYKHNTNICPFCEQTINSDATVLIDSYTKYINDVESQTIKMFQGCVTIIEDFKKSLTSLETENDKKRKIYYEYKTKYIPSLENTELQQIKVDDLLNEFQIIIDFVIEKIQNISNPITISNELLSDLQRKMSAINLIIDDNNKKINGINNKKFKISDENKSVRKELCKSAYNILIEANSTNIRKYHEFLKQEKDLQEEISRKKEAEKISKKKKVARTIKTVLNAFFSDKYTLEEDSFRLIFNKKTLQKGQVKNVLSEGEKNIIAFAYYIGDTYLKVEKEDDFNRLFFIIDDPISSMDFSHVYTLCGVIKDIKTIVDKLTRERFIIFTHNNDFMRILTANNIVDKSLILKDGVIADFNNNLSIPYISHLLDIYLIARKGKEPNHTTANSIRHIIETLSKFQNIETSTDSIQEYIRVNIPNNTKAYTLIQDLSHGSWRSEQSPITNDDYREMCETIVSHIQNKFPKQVDYCLKESNRLYT